MIASLGVALGCCVMVFLLSTLIASIIEKTELRKERKSVKYIETKLSLKKKDG